MITRVISLVLVPFAKYHTILMFCGPPLNMFSFRIFLIRSLAPTCNVFVRILNKAPEERAVKASCIQKV